MAESQSSMNTKAAMCSPNILLLHAFLQNPLLGTSSVSLKIHMLKPPMWLFEDRAFREVIMLQWGLGWRPNLIGLVSYKEMKTQQRPLSPYTYACTKERPREDTARRQLSASQEERPYQKPNLLAPWSWTSRLQNCKKINFCYLATQSVEFCYSSLSKLIQIWYCEVGRCSKKCWKCASGLELSNGLRLKECWDTC